MDLQSADEDVLPLNFILRLGCISAEMWFSLTVQYTSHCSYLFHLIENITPRTSTCVSGLQEILEDDQITKIFFDCREDCNSLKHQYDVHVDGKCTVGNKHVFHFDIHLA